MAIAGCVILGWFVALPDLTRIAGTSAASPLTAMGFGLTSAALLFTLRGHERYRPALLGLALICVIVSQLDLLPGDGLSLNHALLRILSAATDAQTLPARPHPTTIVELLLLIGALLPATATGRVQARVALGLGTIALLIGGVVIIGYVNGVDISRASGWAFVMSVPSTAMALSLSAAIIVWRYRDGWPAIFWTAPEESAGRHLLPLLLTLILIEFGFRLLAGRGIIEDGIADALTLVADMAIIVAIVVPGSQRLAERRRERDDLAGAVELAAVMVLDRDGMILHWSRGCADLYGWPSDQAVGRRRTDLLNSIGVPMNDLGSLMGEDGTFYGETVEYHRDGRKLFIANHVKRLQRIGDRAAVVIAVTNITDSRAAEAALQSSEARLLAAVEAQGLAIIEWDIVDSRIDWTINAEVLCGSVPIRTSEDFRLWGERAVDPGNWADLIEGVQAARAAGSEQFRRTVEVQREPGVFRLFEMATVIIYEDGVAVRAILTCNDVTEHYRREEAIMLGEARLATAVAAQGIFIYEYDVVAERPIWMTSGQHFLGGSSEMYIDLTPDLLWNYVPEIAQQVHAAFRKGIAAGEDRIHFPLEFQRLDGERRYADSWAKIIRDGNGRAIRVIGTHLDITERHEREAALRASEAEMRAILATVPDAMIVCTEAGLIRACSSTAETLFGFARVDLIGCNLLDLAGEDKAGAETLRRRLLRLRRRGQRDIWPIQVIARRADGERVPVSLVLGEAMVGGQRIFVAFGRDMRPHIASEEKFHKLQSELEQVSRLATMGEMGGALAHELSQPLAAIVNCLGAADLTMKMDDNRARLQSAVRSASEQAARASEIIRRLRALISRGEAELRVESVSRLIREAAALALFNSSTLGVELSYDFEDEDRTILADGVQIQQVLVNLIRNGVDAMTAGGSARRELLISTVMRADDFLEIEVSDTGPGINPDIIDTLFSPFTTTKRDGLGFGLAICRRIVEAHRGYISADNNPSGGGVFRFTLPVANGEARQP